MRIAIVYDCLYPYTVGGAERWYHDVVQRLAPLHQLTYITRRQWAPDEAPVVAPGVAVVAVSGGDQLYAPSGRRMITLPLRFGWGVFWHLLRHRRRYDIVHTCAFPYFSLLAARLACGLGGPAVVVDWFEVWSDRYWQEYLGSLAGRVGGAIQRLCIRLSGPAIVFSRLHADRLREEGYRAHPILLSGVYTAAEDLPQPTLTREPVALYVGRHIREKRVSQIPAAIAAARAHIPGLRAIILGDGPERPHVLAEIERLGLCDAIRCPGFVPAEQVEQALGSAMCLLLPSRREGYGLVIVEAAARGTPSIVTRDPDNAAAELIEQGHNGLVVDSAAPEVLAKAIVAVHQAGADAVRRTNAWFRANAARLRIEASIGQIERLYTDVTALTAGRAARRRRTRME